MLFASLSNFLAFYFFVRFEKHPPSDPASARTKDKNQVFTTSHASHILAQICVASGRKIGTVDEVWSCKSCNHRCIVGELRGRLTCPLCHSRFANTTASSHNAGSVIMRSS